MYPDPNVFICLKKMSKQKVYKASMKRPTDTQNSRKLQFQQFLVLRNTVQVNPVHDNWIVLTWIQNSFAVRMDWNRSDLYREKHYIWSVFNKNDVLLRDSGKENLNNRVYSMSHDELYHVQSVSEISRCNCTFCYSIKLGVAVSKQTLQSITPI